MTMHLRQFGEPDMPVIVLVAGFGDNGAMFEALGTTALGEQYSLVAVDLPGTGRSAPVDGRLTLEEAATLVADVVEQQGARVIVGHSVGSIVASLAAHRPGSSIETVLSMEGNLTLADAYFSGSAAQYDSPAAFQEAFLARLNDLVAEANPDAGTGAQNEVGSSTIARYRDHVAHADATSIWELGCDTHRWSLANHAGEVLASAANNVHYFFNPDNMPSDSLEWLSDQAITQHQLTGASHWAAVDQPDLTAEHLLAALGDSPSLRRRIR